MDETISFLIQWVINLVLDCDITVERALLRVVDLANEVIEGHNNSIDLGLHVGSVSSSYTDNQCVFLCYLDKTKKYKKLPDAGLAGANIYSGVLRLEADKYL